jgi:hypothetical protein
MHIVLYNSSITILVHEKKKKNVQEALENTCFVHPVTGWNICYTFKTPNSTVRLSDVQGQSYEFMLWVPNDTCVEEVSPTPPSNLRVKITSFCYR